MQWLHFLPNIRIKMFDSHIMNLPVTFWCKEKLCSYFNQTHRTKIKGPFLVLVLTGRSI